jgi:hypothetical protein
VIRDLKIGRVDTAMLPSFKIVLGALLLCAVLFAISGAGIVLPESHTRFGEVPEVGRSMMQPMIGKERAQERLQRLNTARRAEQLEELRERTLLELATSPAPAEDTPAVDAPATKALVAVPSVSNAPAAIAAAAVETPDPDIIAGPAPGGSTPNLGEPAALQPDGALGSALPNNTIVAAMPAAPVAPAAGQDEVTREPVAVETEDPTPDEALAIDGARLPRVRPIRASVVPRRTVHRIHHHHIAHVQTANQSFGNFGSYQPYQSNQFNQSNQFQSNQFNQFNQFNQGDPSH